MEVKEVYSIKIILLDITLEWIQSDINSKS